VHRGASVLLQFHQFIYIDSARYDWNSGGFTGMTKEELVEKIKGLLTTDDDLSFLLQLKMEDLKTLIASIRDRVDQVGR
jgi:hypothetical protein